MNLSTLVDFGSGDLNFVKDTVNLFIRESASSLRELKSACRSKDWQQVNRLSHSLKSNYATFDMENLRKLAFEIEQKTKNNSGDARIIGKMIDLLERQTTKSYPLLKRELAKLSR